MDLKTIASSVAILAMAGTSVASADPTGPVYPAPGGTTNSSSGGGNTAGEAGGRTLYYTGFNPSDFSALYWTFSSIANPEASTQGASTGNMNFSSYNASTGIALWTSSADMTWSTAFGTQDVATQLELQFQPYTGTNEGPLASGWLTPTTAGAASISSLPSAQSVLDVGSLATANDNYQVWVEFQTADGSPLIDYFNNSHQSGGISTRLSTSGGFYYDAAPEPPVWGMMLLAAGGLMLTARFRTLRPLARAVDHS